MPDELIVLGSSSGVPTKDRFSSAYALKVTGKLFLVDCGAPVSTLLYRYGMDPLDVKALFLSHWHMDHVANLGLFLTQTHQLKRKNPLRVYGPRGTRNKIKRMLFDSFLFLDDLSYQLKIGTVKSKDSIDEALLKVKFFKTQHLEKPKHKTNFGNKATAMGMVLNGPGWRILYSGDLTSPQELAPYSNGVDLLVHELAHHSPEVVADFAEAAKIPYVLISHLAPKYDEFPEKIEKAFTKRYSGQLIVARDGTKILLSQLRADGVVIPQPYLQDSVLPDPTKAFLEQLQSNLGLSPGLSHQILSVAQATLLQPIPLLKSGATRIEVAGAKNSGRDRVEVCLTLDAGSTDIEFKKEHGTAALRRHRLVRIYQEAATQGGALTQEELAHLLNASVRTIRRDILSLRKAGFTVQTIGQ
jgi:ribonuclease Z